MLIWCDEEVTMGNIWLWGFDSIIFVFHITVETSLHIYKNRVKVTWQRNLQLLIERWIVARKFSAEESQIKTNLKSNSCNIHINSSRGRIIEILKGPTYLLRFSRILQLNCNSIDVTPPRMPIWNSSGCLQISDLRKEIRIFPPHPRASEHLKSVSVRRKIVRNKFNARQLGMWSKHQLFLSSSVVLYFDQLRIHKAITLIYPIQIDNMKTFQIIALFALIATAMAFAPNAPKGESSALCGKFWDNEKSVESWGYETRKGPEDSFTFWFC